MVTQVLRDSPERLQRLVEINQQISATLDLSQLLQSIVNAAAELTESEQASIAQINTEDNTLRFVAARWMDEQVMAETRIPLDGSIAGRAFLLRKPVAVHDAQREDFYRKVDMRSGFQTRSVLAVPLLMRGKASGVISALNKKGGQQFDAQDIIVLETLASQAAIALENSRLLNESREAFAHLAELDEMKSNFIAISSHELRIPLGLILGHATYLKEIAEGEELEQVEVIERNAIRLKNIVEDLSQVENLKSDTASLRKNIFDLSALVGKTISSFQSTAEEKEIELMTKMPAKAVSYEGEAEKLRIAFSHLLKNAISFTDNGGNVEVGVRENGDWVMVDFSDTGIGIADGERDRVFERFYQIENHMTRKHGGMGLGLTVAKAMVETHKGEIVVESVEGKGSRFSVRLPKLRY